MGTDVRGGARGSNSTSPVSRGPGRVLELRVVNGFQVLREGTPLRLPAPGRRLLAFLATSGGSNQRSYVAGNLWPEVSEERARGSLRTVLWQLTGAVPGLVELDRQSVRLSSDVWVDVQSAIEVAQRLVRTPAQAALSDCRCPELYGDVLPDWYDDWLILARERFLDLRLHALEVACERMTELGQWGEAIQAGLAAVAAEPLRESTRRTLVRAYRAEGNVSAAVREFERFRALLADELGVGPSERMLALMREIYGGTPSEQEVAS